MRFVRRIGLAAAVAAGLSTPAAAQTVPAEAPAAVAAQAAVEMLDRAAQRLSGATSARDRVRALTETVRAFEAGLEAMRDGLRRAAIREDVLARKLESRREEVARLLGVLQSIGATPPAGLLLHPSGAIGTVQAGLILSEVSPALQAEVDVLRRDLDEISTLRALQESAAEVLQEGLTGVQEARTALSQAISDRSDLPQRFIEDPVKTALLIAASETLSGFASGLSQIAVGPERGAVPDISGLKGTLRLPVQGRILRRAGEADAAGIERPGLVIAAPERSLVTTPTAATIRYRGPLLDYGNVMILEPGKGVLIVLAGLGTVYGDTGQVIPAGHPVGQMPGDDQDLGAVLTRAPANSGASLSETLYMEVREGDSPVDPATWFRTDEE